VGEALEEAFGKDVVEEYMRKINEDGLGEGEVMPIMMMKTMNRIGSQSKRE